MAKLSARGREVLKKQKCGDWTYVLCKTKGRFQILRKFDDRGYNIYHTSENEAVTTRIYEELVKA